MVVMIVGALAVPSFAANQGCPNEGADRRPLGPVTCFLQRHLSFHSLSTPKLLKMGKVAVGFPPYLVVNHERSDGKWRMFRLGWRYDKNWPRTMVIDGQRYKVLGFEGGYIFPTAAYKVIEKPLLYY